MAGLHTGTGYPQVPGSKLEVITNIDGPSSYTAISTGTPPSGGQTLNASDIGLVSIDAAYVMSSDNGQYVGHVIFLGQTAGTTPKSSPQVLIQWIVASTGAEVSGAVNLSARSLRLYVRGNY